MQDLNPFPDLIRLDGGRYNDSYAHRLEGKTYRLFWSDYPKREEAPLVYLLNEDRTEGSRVHDEALERAVVGDWWEKRDYCVQNIGRDEAYFPKAAPPTQAPSGFMAKAMMDLAGGRNPLIPDQEESWTCHRCGTVNREKICTECGGKRP